MNIVDYIIIAITVLFFIKGYTNGIIKEGVSFLGFILVFILAFSLKNPVSIAMYKNLPFFNIGGLLKGISVINILIYEMAAFVLVLSILMILFKLILKLTKLVDKILKMTIILNIPSRILGGILGIVEGVIISFVIVFVMLGINKTRNYVTESKYGEDMLTKIPMVSGLTKPIYKSYNEIITLGKEYKDSDDRDKANKEALDVLLKYKIIDEKNADYLVKTGKIEIKD